MYPKKYIYIYIYILFFFVNMTAKLKYSFIYNQLGCVCVSGVHLQINPYIYICVFEIICSNYRHIYRQNSCQNMDFSYRLVKLDFSLSLSANVTEY